MSPQQQVWATFQDLYGRPPEILVRSPGRINLIGEHTDYNGGPVLPAAIDRAVWLAAAKRADTQCRLFACDYDEGYIVESQPSKPLVHPSWANYLLGVLVEIGWPGGLDLTFGGNLPIGAGVASSAAVQNAMALAANALFQLGHTQMDLVQLTHRAENQFVGVPCGIMDMFAGAMGRRNTFICLNCHSLEYEYLPFGTTELCFVLCHSGVERRLASSEYQKRRQECAQGLAILQRINPAMSALSQVSEDLLAEKEHLLPPTLFRRCRYVVTEIARVGTAVQALRSQDYAAMGSLMYLTHQGLRDDFEVSCPELNLLVEEAMHHPACLGARLMGAGFGGCTLNLVKKSKVCDFSAHVSQAYTRAFKRSLRHWTVHLDDGAEIVFFDV
ncbi:MAG: galactokinase [Saprospiraceae bacterium]|nr:galactokinase [Saprospiraceae bacterium]MDW8483524.1 galactokinase [Saprospiraceae bacterium]